MSTILGAEGESGQPPGVVGRLVVGGEDCCLEARLWWAGGGRRRLEVSTERERENR